MSPPGSRLTKAEALAGLQCAKRLYLERNAPTLAAPGDPAADLRARARAEVLEVARRRFPGGVDVAADGDVAAARRETERLLASPAVRVIYGAVLGHAELDVRIDVLARAGDEAVDLVAVKAATRVQERHETELALHLHVAEAAGLPVARAWLAHLDRGYVLEGALDPGRLLVLVDATERARRLGEALPARLAALRETLAFDAALAIAPGGHCLRPRRCPFLSHCQRSAGYPVRLLPRLDSEQLARLAALGIADVRDVPPDAPFLSALQRRACAVLQSGVPFRDPAIRRSLETIARPAHFVDFETFSSALPRHAGTRPYENVPFQWSDHVLAADGAVTHAAFLHDEPADPRVAFARSLLDATEGAASVVTYSSFEAEVLRALAEQLPALAGELEALRARVVDLLPIVRDHCYHAEFRGSFSLKTVLPVLVPGLGYDDLEIRDGLAASASRAHLVDPRTPPARKAEVRRQLLAYCARDTWALVALYRTLWDGR